MGRDSVSHYVRGINLPTPAHLWALAKALGCEPYDLVPSMGMPSVDDKRKPAMRVDTLESGRAHIVMDRVVSLATALKIQQAVKADDELWTQSEEHTSELQSLMRISYAVFCLAKHNTHNKNNNK